MRRIAILLYRPWRNADDAPADKLQLGAAARRLLDDPVLALAFERVERRLTQTWANTAIGAADEREATYRLLAALKLVKSELHAFVNNAKVIEAEAKRKEQADAREAQRRERAFLA